MPDNTIIVAVDDELFGEAIAKFITGGKWPAGIHFLVVHVVDPQPLEELLPYAQEIVEATRNHGWHLVHEVGNAIRNGLQTSNVEEKVVEGDPRLKIPEIASAICARSIIMGSHSRKYSINHRIGSVSRAVTAIAPCSVIVVRLPAEQRDLLPQLTLEAPHTHKCA